ncbi:right-handed parallel beta-helix repeat-containing protein [Crateriforma spongiae]|uniref:right-handed parallel beta-helix repeat-containing protein n=1 Tax=Crateriforma spongiae TaxID=2724528 RepID=UPI001444EFAD|nr:right-handed parallel beta-helix repeat-containing protein [Crateriforma spongiae]
MGIFRFLNLSPVQHSVALGTVAAMILSGTSGSRWVCADEEATPYQLFVDIHADDGGTGTASDPFPNLEAAKRTIRQRRDAGAWPVDGAVVVNVAPGVYAADSSLRFGSADGGTESAPVVYRSTQPGAATLQGGVTLKASDFRPIRKALDDPATTGMNPGVWDRVLVCDLSDRGMEFPKVPKSYRAVPPAPWLYVDGRPMELARWPNHGDGDGWARFHEAIDTGLGNPDSEDPAKRQLRPGSFRFDDPRPERWDIQRGVWLCGYWTHDWSDEVIQIAQYDLAEKAIKLAAPHHYGIKGKTWGNSQRRFFAVNVLSELDAPGEWYLDRQEQRLFLDPPTGFADASITLATLTEPILKIEHAKHLRFEGFTIECGHGDAIDVRDGHNVQIAGCTIRNMGAGGVRVTGSENQVRSCDLYQLGTFGISLSGGDRKQLTMAGNVADNNHVHHYGLFQRTYAAGISAGGCGQTITNNLIHDAPHNAIRYGGNEHRIERNEIHHVVLETGDAGAFYTGRDWTSQGNVLRHNYIHDLGVGNTDHVNTMAIYLDDCDSGDTLEGNIMVRAGRAVMMGGGRDNKVINNLVIDCPIGIHLDSRGMTWSQWNNPEHPSWMLEEKALALDYQSPIWAQRYPSLAKIMADSPKEPLHNRFARNVFVDCDRRVCQFDSNVMKLLGKLDVADNVAVSSTGSSASTVKIADITGFSNQDAKIDATGDDKVDAYLKQQDASGWMGIDGWEPIPVDKIGLRKDVYRKTLP